MGCKTRGYRLAECSGSSGANPEHCNHYTPVSGGVTFEVEEYPVNTIRQGNYEIPGRETDRVMYPYVEADLFAATSGSTGSGTGNPSVHCGKQSRTSPCQTFGRNNTTVIQFLDYYPKELSFDLQFSDTWISYLYDTSNNSGIIGSPCYYIETETRTGDGGGSREICHPCTNFTSTPEETLLSYTASETLTNDPDCPHPTLFGIGTTSDKLVFSYDAFSTVLPNGVLDWEFSYDGVTYTDVWDETNLQGAAYESTQNPWQSGDENFDDFEIYDFSDGSTRTNFIIKVRLAPIYDDSGASTVFTGTRWTITELLNNGTGYQVGDVFTMSYTHTHPDNSQTTLTMNLRVKTVGQITNTTNQTGFDVLRVGDTLNGHLITRAFHTEVGEFPYHIVYLDGNGLDFTKETQYTSDRNHVVTAKAGYGIRDRACLIGLYEFLDKSLQFSTADINKNAPEVFNSIVQPSASVTITNGAVTDLSFNGNIISFDLNYIENNLKDSYSAATNVSLTGGNGSGAVVDIEVGDDGRISALIVVNGGQDYEPGDILTIPGATKPAGSATNATIRLTNISTVGSGFANLKVSPILEITGSPADADGDGSQDALVEGTFANGSLASVNIVRGGSGYTQEDPPNIFVRNVFDVAKEIFENAAHRDDLVPEFQDIVKSLPTGPEKTEYEVTVSEDDLQAIADSYSFVPKTQELSRNEPKLEVKMDPDQKRIQQLPQQKYSKDATEPLKEIMVVDYDTQYLDGTDIDNDFKDIIREEKPASAKRIRKQIDDITQPRIPEFKSNNETKIETCSGSFTQLPTASQFTKYIMRQYRADPAKETTINITLKCIPQDIGCTHFTCNAPTLTPGYSEQVAGTDENGNPTTTTYTYSYSMSPLIGPGAKTWEASGTMKIYHDLTRAARTVTLATDAYGNPFSD